MAQSQYSPRRLLRKELHVFRAIAANPIRLWMRNAPASPDTTYTPGQLYTSAVDPIMDSDNYHWVYIVGKWKETDTENFDSPGRQRTVSGQITVPMIYKTLLATCEYIDPYLDGSMFLKVGASVDQGRLYVLQTIKSMSLTNPSEVV